MNKMHWVLTIALIANAWFSWDVIISSNYKQQRQLGNHTFMLWELCVKQGYSTFECNKATLGSVLTKPKAAVEAPAGESPAMEEPERRWEVEVIENGREKRLENYIREADGVLR